MRSLQSESLSSSSESQIVRGVSGVKGYLSRERYERSRGFPVCCAFAGVDFLKVSGESEIADGLEGLSIDNPGGFGGASGSWRKSSRGFSTRMGLSSFGRTISAIR